MLVLLIGVIPVTAVETKSSRNKRNSIQFKLMTYFGRIFKRNLKATNVEKKNSLEQRDYNVVIKTSFVTFSACRYNSSLSTNCNKRPFILVSCQIYIG